MPHLPVLAPAGVLRRVYVWMVHDNIRKFVSKYSPPDRSPAIIHVRVHANLWRNNCSQVHDGTGGQVKTLCMGCLVFLDRCAQQGLCGQLSGHCDIDMSAPSTAPVKSTPGSSSSSSKYLPPEERCSRILKPCSALGIYHPLSYANDETITAIHHQRVHQTRLKQIHVSY